MQFFKRKTTKYITHKTTDPYLAGWLVLNGAIIQEIQWKRRRLTKDITKKRMRIFLQRVDPQSLDDWKQRKAHGDIRAFVKAREYVKKEAYKV